MDWQVHKEMLVEAVRLMFANDSFLLHSRNGGINERAISAKFAHHLSPLYAPLNVDCEYNREGDEIKRLPVPEDTRTDDIRGKTIFPDIIVHKRGDNTSNLIVIEIKKRGNEDIEGDIQKLTALTDDRFTYKYEFGFHIIFDVNDVEIKVYEDGDISEEKTRDLDDFLKKNFRV